MRLSLILILSMATPNFVFASPKGPQDFDGQETQNAATAIRGFVHGVKEIGPSIVQETYSGRSYQGWGDRSRPTSYYECQLRVTRDLSGNISRAQFDIGFPAFDRRFTALPDRRLHFSVKPTDKAEGSVTGVDWRLRYFTKRPLGAGKSISAEFSMKPSGRISKAHAMLNGPVDSNAPDVLKDVANGTVSPLEAWLVPIAIVQGPIESQTIRESTCYDLRLVSRERNRARP